MDSNLLCKVFWCSVTVHAKPTVLMWFNVHSILLSLKHIVQRLQGQIFVVLPYNLLYQEHRWLHVDVMVCCLWLMYALASAIDIIVLFSHFCKAPN